ncbi:MAG TPA: hypothetical protein V6C63_06395 [Allocoleopsis sp.]
MLGHIPLAVSTGISIDNLRSQLADDCFPDTKLRVAQLIEKLIRKFINA